MAKTSLDSFQTRKQLQVGSRCYDYFHLASLESQGFQVARLPFSLKVLLENVLRNEDGIAIFKKDVEAIAKWDSQAVPSEEISYTPARVLLQDFTGVPAVVDLAAMRDAMADIGGHPEKINPLCPAELVIDHSVQVDSFGKSSSFDENVDKEYERNAERYAFLRWGQSAFNNFRVVPPGTGIVHQVNLEYLARVVFDAADDKGMMAYPDTLVGTDSHTTMVNGLGVLGWGVGGIEAEAAMLGQPIPMLVPQVVGFKLRGKLSEGTTATDLVLTVTEMLRKHGVVGQFVEFFGEGILNLSLADRATIGNMSPEYGATCTMFPVDDVTLEYLRFTARDEARVALVEAYMKAQGMFYSKESVDPEYSDVIELDLATVVPSLAGPKRPQDRVSLMDAKSSFEDALKGFKKKGGASSAHVHMANGTDADFDLHDGSVVIAAITSCTNTSNPSVMIGAGLLAKKAVEKGLTQKPWVKTSLAPGSQVVTEYLKEAGLTPYLDKLGFQLVGYGCTTCIGNSGPLPDVISAAIEDEHLVACSVLSGNRNFEGRINPNVQANYLASPPLVVAYALAGRMDCDLCHEPLGQNQDGHDVYLKDIWPTQDEIRTTVQSAVKTKMFREKYGDVFKGDAKWASMEIPEGGRYTWDEASTYVRRPSFLMDIASKPGALSDICDARVMALLGDSVTTDHISPAGSIKKDSPAGVYLTRHGIDPKDFNSYGSRRGNHEVMVRGTFANIRLRNQLAPGTEGGWTRHLPDGEQMSIYDAAVKYAAENTALIVLAGKEYGSGSSRDWAAKGTRMLGIKAVIAESFERIHRSNLIGMGVLPLQFQEGENPASLGLNGEEVYSIAGIAQNLKPKKTLTVRVNNGKKSFDVICRIDTPMELEYYRHGGILSYVLRQL